MYLKVISPRWGFSTAIVALALVVAMAACKRRPPAEPEEEETGEMKSPAADSVAAPVASKTSHLDPLTSAPWLGHADDGSLVKIEFFSSDDPPAMTCRTSVKTANGNARAEKSSFTANPQLTSITWGDGKSSASYSPATQALDAIVVSNAGVHRGSLQQVSADTRPELSSFRTSVPDDERSRAAQQEFAAALGKGADWWESGAAWEVLATPEAITAPAEYTALIRPAGKTQLKLPALQPGGDFNIPLVCNLPPGSALGEAQTNVGVVAELHHPDSLQAAWIINLLNPGAITQELNALWAHRDGEPTPSGPATLYIYLAQTHSEGDTTTSDITKPISNLLKLKIELAGPPTPTPKPAPEPPAEEPE